MRRVHYVTVISPGPLVIARVPWPLPRWRNVLKALTPVMREHGLKQKDITGVESATYFAPDATAEETQLHPKTAAKDVEFRARLDAAFEGDPNMVPKFWLYDWTGDEFALVREPTEG